MLKKRHLSGSKLADTIETVWLESGSTNMQYPIYSIIIQTSIMLPQLSQLPESPTAKFLEEIHYVLKPADSPVRVQSS